MEARSRIVAQSAQTTRTRVERVRDRPKTMRYRWRMLRNCPRILAHEPQAVTNRLNRSRNVRDRSRDGRRERLTGLERARYGFGLGRTGWRRRCTGRRRRRHELARPRTADGAERGTNSLDRIGRVPYASYAGPTGRRMESYRLEAGAYLCRTRLDGSEMLPFGRRTLPPGRGICSYRVATQPSEEPVSPIGARRSDHSGGRRRTDATCNHQQPPRGVP